MNIFEEKNDKIYLKELQLNKTVAPKHRFWI